MYPVLFPIGDFLFFSFGLFLGGASMFSFFFVKKLIDHREIKIDILKGKFLLFTFVFIFFGKFADFLLNNEFYKDRSFWSCIMFYDGNFYFLPAWIATFFLMLYLTRKSKLDFWFWNEIFFVVFLICTIFMEIGKFFAGYGYGKETDSFFAIEYPDPEKVIGAPFIIGARHPVQIYLAVSFLIIFAIFYPLIYKKKYFYSIVGIIISGFVLFYNGIFIDQGTILNFTHLQIFAIFLMLIGIVEFFIFSFSVDEIEKIEKRKKN